MKNKPYTTAFAPDVREAIDEACEAACAELPPVQPGRCDEKHPSPEMVAKRVIAAAVENDERSPDVLKLFAMHGAECVEPLAGAAPVAQKVAAPPDPLDQPAVGTDDLALGCIEPTLEMPKEAVETPEEAVEMPKEAVEMPEDVPAHLKHLDHRELLRGDGATLH